VQLILYQVVLPMFMRSATAFACIWHKSGHIHARI
jgi:hypothetical protein